MIALLLTLLACGVEENEAPTTLLPQLRNPDSSEHIIEEVDVQTEAQEDLAPADQLPRRDNKRMDIDQLQNAIKMATGIEWTQGAGTSGEEQFSVLSATLGVPDFRNSVISDRSPSLVFEKFLKDAASSVCSKIIDQQSNVFFVHATIQDTWTGNPQAVEDNIRHQLLRFHGMQYPASDPELNHWEWLWRSIYNQTTGEVEERTAVAWRGVCVALIIHPRFAHY